MTRNILYTSATVLFFALALGGCSNSKTGSGSNLRSGDLLFVGVTDSISIDDSTSMSDAIVSATGTSGNTNYIHVAIVEVDSAGIWVIDATTQRGVARRPIDTFFADFRLPGGTMPIMDVMRLKDTSAVGSFVQAAKLLVGRDYDLTFMPNNGMYYCSELVRDCYVRRHTDTLFDAKPMNFLSPDGSCSTYWVGLFDSLGMPVPQGIPGTNPNDMHNAPILKSAQSPLPFTENKKQP